MPFPEFLRSSYSLTTAYPLRDVARCELPGRLPGTLATNYNGAMYTTVIDSGSNAYYFPDASIAPCGAANLTGFYCPQQTPLPLVGQIVGEGKSPNSATIDFQIGNAGLLLGNVAQAVWLGIRAQGALRAVIARDAVL